MISAATAVAYICHPRLAAQTACALLQVQLTTIQLEIVQFIKDPLCILICFDVLQEFLINENIINCAIK